MIIYNRMTIYNGGLLKMRMIDSDFPKQTFKEV